MELLDPFARLWSAARAVPPARWRTAFLALLAAVVAVAAVQHVHKAQKLSRLGTQTKTAFLRWRVQILGDETPGRGPVPGLKRGDDIYRAYNYPNPPVMALILWPLAELPPTAGAMAWFALKVGMAAACLVWAFRLCGPMPDWAKALTVLLALHPILGDLSHGNVNLFIAFVVFGGLELYRRGWDGSAGLVLALAVACKVTPALLIPYFGWKCVTEAVRRRSVRAGLRQTRVLAGCAVGLGLWWLIVPGAALGWSHNLTMLESWYDGMVRRFVVEGKATSEHANQSIPGLTARLLTDSASVYGYDEDDQQFAEEKANLTDIGPAGARWVVRGFQAAFVCCVALFCWAPADRRGLRTAAEVSLVLIGMLLFSERTWKHHSVTLILPFAVLTAALASGSPGFRRYLAATLAVVAGLTLGPSLLPESAQDTALTYGTHTAAFLLLAAGVCVVMWQARRAGGSDVSFSSLKETAGMGSEY